MLLLPAYGLTKMRREPIDGTRFAGMRALGAAALALSWFLVCGGCASSRTQATKHVVDKGGEPPFMQAVLESSSAACYQHSMRSGSNERLGDENEAQSK